MVSLNCGAEKAFLIGCRRGGILVLLPVCYQIPLKDLLLGSKGVPGIIRTEITINVFLSQPLPPVDQLIFM